MSSPTSDFQPLPSGLGSHLSTVNPNPVRSTPSGSKPRLAYILACGHSGSTLLAMLLGAHPEVISIGELRGVRQTALDSYRCSCGDMISQCSFWNAVVAAMRAKGMDYSPNRTGTDLFNIEDRFIRRMLGPLHRGPWLEQLRDAALFVYPLWHRHLHEVQKRNAALVQTLLELSEAKVVVDSSKVGLRLKYLLLNKALEVRVIRLIRDGRGVALTATDEGRFADAADPRLRAGGTGREEWRRRWPVSFGANAWRRSNEEADCLLAGLDKSQWMEVRYEQLCTRPEETLGRICRFLGLDPQQTRMDFRSAEQHIVGNGMRLDRTSEITLDERWRTHLSAEDLRIFDGIAGDLNRRYGYV